MVPTWYVTTNLVDYVIVNKSLTNSIQNTRVHEGVVIDAKSKDHNLVFLEFIQSWNLKRITKFQIFRDIVGLED